MKCHHTLQSIEYQQVMAGVKAKDATSARWQVTQCDQI